MLALIIAQHIASLLSSNSLSLSFIDVFFKMLDIKGLLKEYGAGKTKGIPNIEILKFLVCLLFRGETSVNRALKNNPHAGMCMNTIRRLLENPKIENNKIAKFYFCQISQLETLRF